MNLKQYITITTAFLIMVTLIQGCGSKKNKKGNIDLPTVRTTDTIHPENDTLNDMAEEPEITQSLPGDTLYEYDGKTVMLHFVEDDDELSSVFFSEITTYLDNKPIKVCRVNGYNSVTTSKGKTLKVGIGIDTLSYRLTSLPKTIDPVWDLAGNEVKKHRVVHRFKIGNYPLENSFIMSAYLPEKQPDYINRIMATIMHHDLETIFSDYDKRLDLMDEYLRLEENPERYRGLNTDSATPKEIGKYFARRFEQLYRKKYTNEIKNGDSHLEEYVLETAPLWNSDGGSMTTYRFYTYQYGGGAHGMMHEFYLTFDNADGRVLGYADILGDEGIKNAIPILKKKLNSDSEYREGYTATLGKEEKVDNNDRLLNEVFQGYVYPRPAITRNGIVFTYQPYDKGSFAEGILHFLLPFSMTSFSIK